MPFYAFFAHQGESVLHSVSLKVESIEKASRLELLVRLVYWIPLLIVTWVLQVLAGISWIVTFFSVLVLGKRFSLFSRLMTLAMVYNLRFYAYYSLLTDERPPIIPEGI
ncbi:MAG: DUF4389 domain-containing protein [Candidatus Diapherotrites archaeon]|uniref:DUF4389 domain-containing protein n=1 Tax=Candidatus Iainarchaeum sp. TaxID=3101447 RepID=A0A8T4LEE3_9ARCH|nr:DUF4389 domain-containing protein [Candidatus Diapherotrites archaeon]